MSDSAAQRAMRAARMIWRNKKLSYLSQRGLLALAARSVPEPVVSEIIARIMRRTAHRAEYQPRDRERQERDCGSQTVSAAPRS